LKHRSTSGAPVSGTFFRGEVIVDASGDFWICVSGSGSNAGVWRKIGGLSSAGAYHPIAPARIYDSRRPMTPMSSGKIAVGSARTLTLKDSRNSSGGVALANVIPPGATAVTYNLSVTATVLAGYLAVNKGVNNVLSASAINWAAGQTIANAATVAMDTSRRVTIVCGGAPGASTHFIVDVTGYYL
jgi:hypothetical protein